MLELETRDRVIESAKAFFSQLLSAIQIESLDEDYKKQFLRGEKTLTVLNAKASDSITGYRTLCELFSFLVETPYAEKNRSELSTLYVNSINPAVHNDTNFKNVQAAFNFNVAIVVWIAYTINDKSPYAEADLFVELLKLDKDLFVMTLALLNRVLEQSWLNSSDVMYSLEYAPGLDNFVVSSLQYLANESPDILVSDVMYTKHDPANVAFNSIVETIRGLLLVSQVSNQKRISGIPQRYIDLVVKTLPSSSIPLFATLCVLSEQLPYTVVGVTPNAKGSYDFELIIDKIDSIGYSIQK